MPNQNPINNQAFYDHYHQQNRGHQNWRGVIKPISANNFTYYYHLKALKPLLSHLAQPRILDVGCGVGTLSIYLATHTKAQVLGIDLSSRAITLATQAQTALHLKNLTFKTTPLTPKLGSFDLIIASEIIEHVANPTAFLKQLWQQLNPGGYLLLTTPNRTNWLRLHGYLQAHDRYAGHVKIFTQTELAAVFTSQDWQLQQLTPTEGPLRMLLFITALNPLIRIIRGPLVPLFHRLDEWLAGWFGFHDLQVVAQKKPLA